MNLSDVSQLRLISQHLLPARFSTPNDLVKYMGAMQAQDFPMAKWALGVRLPSSAEQDIEASLSSSEILRTHLLRPTWHIVSSEDISWMLDLTAAQVKSAQSYRERQLELTDGIFSRSNKVLETTLGDGRHRTRNELIDTLEHAGIRTDQNRASHLFARAELEKIICSGASINGKTTYALFSQRVTSPHKLSRDESLAELAKRYFTSRSPATLQDFTWWSGLPTRDASVALEMVKTEFFSETIDGQTYWWNPGLESTRPIGNSAFLLPTYDEFILSYTDRSAAISPGLEQHMKEISDRGVFWPILLLNGQVTGIWKRVIKKDLLTIKVEPFSALDPDVAGLVNEAIDRYARFTGKKLISCDVIRSGSNPQPG